MWDILKRRKNWEKQNAQSRAFVKILLNRMPQLDNLLDDWGYYDIDSWAYNNVSDKIWLYTNQSKESYLSSITPGIRYRDLITFKDMREDRLKCEIFVNITFEPHPSSENIYKLDYDADITLTLGDKEILTFTWNEDKTRVHILKLIATYYGNKERLKEQNIYTTLRFNGMSIRSYVYSVNRLGDQSLNDMIIDMGGRKDIPLEQLTEGQGINRWKGKFVSFAHLVEYLTGNTLSHYGGAQTKLFKKSRKRKNPGRKQLGLTEATKIAHLKNLKSVCLERFKKDAPYIPYTNIVVGAYDNIEDDFYLDAEELLELDLEELRKSDFKYFLEIINTAHTRDKKRRVKTRDVKIKDKEKGDWEASFEVVDLKILRLEIQVYVNGKFFIDIRIQEPKDFLYLLQDKLGEFQNTFTFLRWHMRPYIFDDSYKYRQGYGETGVKARTPEQLSHKQIIRDLRAGRITMEEAEKLQDEMWEKRDLKPQQHWKKKLRRKQYPVQMAFLHYQNRYVLYNLAKLKKLFPGWRKN